MCFDPCIPHSCFCWFFFYKLLLWTVKIALERVVFDRVVIVCLQKSNNNKGHLIHVLGIAHKC